MKNGLAVILSLLVSKLVFANVTLQDLDKNFCPYTVEQSGPNLYTFELLHAKSLYGDFFIQRRMSENHRISLLTTPKKTIQLASWIGRIKDFTVVNESIFILTNDFLIELDHKANFLDKFALPKSNQYKSLGLSFHESDYSIYIARGKRGILRFELNTRTFGPNYAINTVNQSGHLSSAVSVDSEGDLLYVAMTGQSEKGFNGVTVFYTKTQSIENLAEYNKRRSGVVSPDARIYINDSKVFINNMGWIHELTINQIQTSSTVRPTWRAIPLWQGNHQQYIMLKGDFIFEDNQIMGCGRYRTLDDKYFGKAFAFTY